jgi:multidrug efflux pump subunit AcrA (membrane-fusion protein)
MADEGHDVIYPSLAEIDESTRIRLYSTRKVESYRHLRIAAAILLLLIIGVALSLIFLPWVQTVQGKGRVIAYLPNDRQQSMEAPIDGRVAHWYVLEGEQVKKDQPLADMEDLDPLALDRLIQQRDATKVLLEAYNHALSASRKNVERQESLFKRGLSSQRAYELAVIEVAKAQTEVSKASAELAKIESSLSRQSSQLVRSPRDGTILRILAPQGGVVVKKGDTIAMLVPETKDRAVELLVTGNDLPLLSLGRDVRLQFEGWPAIQFLGWPSVAIGTFRGKVGVIDSSSDDGKGNFRIIVFPAEDEKWPDERYLRQGVRAVGWVLLDTVRLGWELWRQFNGFPQTSAPGETQNMKISGPKKKIK